MLTVDVATSEDPVIEKVLNEQTSSRPLQQTYEKCGGERSPDEHRAAQIASRDATNERDNGDGREKHIGVEEKPSIAPVRAQIAEKGAIPEEVSEGEQPRRDPLPIRALPVTLNDVVPANQVVNRLHGPIGSPRSNSPADLVWCDLRLRRARCRAPRRFKPAKLTIKAAVGGFRRHRIIAADLQDKPFCNQRHADQLRRNTVASMAPLRISRSILQPASSSPAGALPELNRKAGSP